ncbi:MAG: HNH endonuclease signature motif containing protein, partial [Nanoarchaeota archaeon]
GSKPWNKGLTKETDERIDYNRPTTFKKEHGMNKGENHPNFNNWSSRKPYGKEFGPELKLQIKERDNFICQECGDYRDLTIHHIDYNKKNNNPNNLITLCRSCHSQTNFNRNDWKNYFTPKLWEKKDVKSKGF